MTEATERPVSAADPETARLLRKLDNAGYWVEHLILTADVVSGVVLDCPLPTRQLTDGKVLEFAIEEAKASIGRIRDATDELIKNLGVDPYPLEG